MGSRRARLAIALFALPILCASCAHMDKDPLTAEERLLLGASYEKKGEVDLALSEYSRALSNSPKDWRPRFAIGSLYLSKKDFANAIESLELAKRSSNSPMVLNNLALAYLGAGRMEDAEVAIRAALGTGGPKIHAYLDTLGVVLMKQGDLKGAHEALVAAKDACPKDDGGALDGILEHLNELAALEGR